MSVPQYQHLRHSDVAVPPILNGCVCGTTSATKQYRRECFSGNEVVRCAKCGTLRLQPRPTSQEIAKFFQQAYFTNESPRFWSDRRAPIFHQTYSKLQKHSIATALDVGTNYGHFVAYLRNCGIDAVGCDLSEQTVEEGRQTLGVPLYAGNVAELELSPREAITHLDTLYYVQDPVGHLRACAELTADEGIIVLRLRNPDPILKSGKLPCPHLWGFTIRGITGALEQAGWTVLSVEPGMPSQHWSHRFRSLLAQVNCTIRDRFDTGIWTLSYCVVAAKSD